MGFTAYPETEQELHQPEVPNSPTVELLTHSHALAGGFKELAARGVDVFPASPLGVTTLTPSGSEITVRKTAGIESSPGTRSQQMGCLQQ